MFLLYFPLRAATKRPLIIPPPPHICTTLFPQKIKGKTSTLAPLFLPRRLPGGEMKSCKKKEKTRERMLGEEKKHKNKTYPESYMSQCISGKKGLASYSISQERQQGKPFHDHDHGQEEEGIVEKSPHFLRRRGSFSFRQMGAVSAPPPNIPPFPLLPIS